jgi:hypothetical protein
MIANPIYRTGRIETGGIVSEFEAGKIVDDGTWYAAQSPASIRDERTAKGKWLLSGLIRCDSCGRALTPWRPAKSRSIARRYRCVQAGCLERVSVAALGVEALVTEAAFTADLKLVEQQPETVDLETLETELAKSEARLAQTLLPDAQDALGDVWAATAKSRRVERDEAARELGEGRAMSGVAGSGKVLRLGHIWDDLAPSQQREALRWVFQEVRVRKVPLGHAPDLTFIPRATRLWGSLVLAPPELELQ